MDSRPRVKLPSGSRLGLAMKCAGSFILPIVKSEPGEAAKRGTATHALVEGYIRSGRKIPEGCSEEQRTLLRGIGELLGPPAEVFERPELGVAVYPGDRHSELLEILRVSEESVRLGHAGERSGELAVDDNHNGERVGSVREQREDNSVSRAGLEMALGIDGDLERSFRLLFHSDGKSTDANSEGAHSGVWPVDRTESFLAIADLVCGDGPQAYRVYDWKTGSSQVDAPEWNWQLILPAIALWVVSGRDTSFCCDIYIGYLDKYRDGISNSDWTRSFRADHDFCARCYTYLERLYKASKSATPETVTLYEGKHCVFCPARDRCPAKIGALSLAAHAMQADFDKAWFDDGDLMRAVIAMQETTAMRKKAAVEILERNGGTFDLGDGREAVLSKAKKTTIFARKIKHGQKERPNASEDGKSGAESQGAGVAEGVGEGTEDQGAAASDEGNDG